MADLKYITMTQLFWDTLEKHRGHKRYPDFRAKIARCVEMKMSNRSFATNSDDQFAASASKWLVGIWHCKLSVNPDVIMFYTMKDDTISLAMVGSHHDYPHAGKHFRKAEILGKKIRTWVDKGHVPSPRWDAIRWSVPSDLVGNYELEETTADHLEAIMDDLRQELVDAPIYRRVNGRELEDAEEDVITAWFTDTENALVAVEAAQERVRAIDRSRESERTPIAAFALRP